ncbi:tetratricopeptide repeat protein [Desulfomarina sp.]
MKNFIPYIIFAVLLTGTPVFASELLRVSRAESGDMIQLYFLFDKAPTFSETINERRLNLIFNNTELKKKITFFKPDDKIVKILSHTENGDFILSLFFRYTPQHYTVSRNGNDKIVVEILPGNRYSKSYKDLAKKLEGLTVIDRSRVDYTNPYVFSPYVKNWMTFFNGYESPLTISVPVKFTLPPFPIIGMLPPDKEKNLQILSPELFKLAGEGLWEHLATRILERLKSEKNIETQKKLALCYGEVLFRADNFVGAYKQLYLLQEKYDDELIGSFARYVLLLLRAIHEDPHIAEFELTPLAKKISLTNPLTPYLHLSRIEVSLASAKFSAMNNLLLEDDIAFPPPIEEIREIRQADYWYGINQPVKAYAAYRLVAGSEYLARQPYSLNGNCATLYSQRKFMQSSSCYDQLSTLVLNKTSLGMIRYRAEMSRLKFMPKEKLIDSFTQIENAFPGTEAGNRAAIKKTDLLLLQKSSALSWALKSYASIYEKSIVREPKEEALFKQALVLSLLDRKGESITLLQQLIREFRYGHVLSSAQALLIDLLPGEIKRLVGEKQYLKALVLAKQNKDLFRKNWLDSRYLVDIARAYDEIGVYEEAQRLYLYLIEISEVDQKEQFFLPLVKASFNHGNYTLVEDFAAQYTFNYPHGQYADDILLLRLKAFINQERFTEALRLLPSPLPQKKEFYELAATVYYRMDDFKKCAKVFDSLEKLDRELSQEELVMFGESLMKTEQPDRAEAVFLKIKETNPFYDQSLFHLAELAKRKGNEKKALRLFRKIAEKGTNERWRDFARKALEFEKTASGLQIGMQ